MSLYKGSAQQKGFGAYLVDIPDPSEKIRKQGLEAMRGMEDQIQHNAQQAERVVRASEQNAAIFEQQMQQNFQDKQHYADVLAKAKWKNYETAVKNEEIKAKQKGKDWDALMNLTKSGAKLGKMAIDHNRKMTDQFVDQLYRDYGMNRAAFNSIKSAEDKVISDNTSLQSLLRKMEVSGDVPMDVISRIRRSGGYMSLAVSKNEAVRWGRQLTGRLGARSNEKIQLPGMETPISLNDALATGGPTVDAVVDELVKQELYVDGKPRFSNKVLALAGVAGPDGFIARTKGSFAQKANKIVVDGEWEDRHQETIQVIKSFIGPAQGSSQIAGVKGIDAAIYYFAGGQDASREQLSASRTRVVGALIDGLESKQLSWDEVRGLKNYIVKTKGAPKGQRWSKLFPKEWNQLVEAGDAYVDAVNAENDLADSNLALEGRGFLTDMKNLVATENPSIDTLTKFYKHATAPERAHTHADAAKFLAKEMAANKTRANDAQGTAVLMARAENNEIITQEEIDKWNFSPSTKSLVQAEVAKRNQMLPQTGENGTKERLAFQVETKLTDLITRKNTWYTNGTHKDTKLYAERKAAGYYRLAREMKGMSHEDAYNYALQEIGKDIGSPQQAPRDPYFEVVTKKGAKAFKGALPRQMEEIKIDPVVIGQELHMNPGNIYTKNYFDPSEIAAKASKGIFMPIHPTALAVQSLTRGRINAVDAMQAQLQLIRDQETKEFGAPRTPLLPDDYVKRYKNESGRISPLGQRLLEDYNIVGVNKAYTKSGYAPPYQTSYYQKADKIIETGDINNVSTPDGKMGKSLQVLKFNVSDRTIGEVLRLMQNGTITTAGNAQFDLESLTETLAQSGLTADSKFNFTNQKTLQKTRFKKYGLAGFPHIQPDEYDVQLGDNLHQAVNNEKITPTYFRDMSSCNDAACTFMRNNPELFPHLGGTKQ